MKTNVLVTAILMMGVIFTSCYKENINVIPSGRITSSNLSVSGINNIDVSDIFHVYVSFSETEESAYIEANENLHSLVQVYQDGETLVVGLKKNTNFSGVPVLNLYLKTNSLHKVTAEGRTVVMFENILDNNHFEIDLSGACDFKGSVNTEKLVAKIEGASTLDLEGSAEYFEIDATGASEMSSFDFTSNKLNAYLEGGCKVSLTVMQTLDIEAIGASKVYYKGSGIVEHQKLTGASEIVKFD